MKILLFSLINTFTFFSLSQTFVGGTGLILDNQTVEIPVSVTLSQQQINTTSFGLETVCLNLVHTYLADLTIKIKAPDGTIKLLSSAIGGGDDDMVNTCYNQSASIPITSGVAPFTGTFKPMGQMGAVNNGQNPNGIWKLIVTDDFFADEGSVQNWSITFGNSPADYFQLTESNLPIVVIATNGNQIDTDIKVQADMGIIYNGPGIRNYLSDPFNEYNGKIGIEYRGNYSFSLPQKPYSIELNDILGNSIDSSLLGMPAENDWLLLANYNDKSFARNALPYSLFEKMGHYGVRYRHVDVILDGEYQGIYLLSEKIKRDSNRVDIPKLNPNEIAGLDVTGGYIFKVDYWDNTNSWQSNFSPIGFPNLDIHYVYYYPKPNDIVQEQKTYIQNFINDFETALYSTNFNNPTLGYKKFIQTSSFIDYFIINELTRNIDGFKKSRFFYKKKDNADGTYGKLKAGPVWDFDWALKDIWSGSQDGSGFMYEEVAQDVNAPGWYIRLLQDSVFANDLRCRYANLRNSILSETYMFQFIDSIATVVDESQNWHYLTWGNMGAATGTGEVQPPSQSYAEEMTKLKDWITRRINWLDDNMPGNLNNCGFLNLAENADFNFQVFPNPFQSSIHLVFAEKPNEEIRILLLDGAGRIIHEGNYSPSYNELEIKIENLTELSKGIYFLEVTIGNQKVLKKLVK